MDQVALRIPPLWSPRLLFPTTNTLLFILITFVLLRPGHLRSGDSRLYLLTVTRRGAGRRGLQWQVWKMGVRQAGAWYPGTVWGQLRRAFSFTEACPWWFKRHQESRTYAARSGPQPLHFLVCHGVGVGMANLLRAGRGSHPRRSRTGLVPKTDLQAQRGQP